MNKMLSKTKNAPTETKISRETALKLKSINYFIVSIFTLAVSLVTWTKLAELNLLLYKLLLIAITIFAIYSTSKPIKRNLNVESTIAQNARAQIERLRKDGVPEEMLAIMEMPVNMFYDLAKKEPKHTKISFGFVRRIRYVIVNINRSFARLKNAYT